MNALEYFKEKGQAVQEKSDVQTVKELKTAGMVLIKNDNGYTAEYNNQTMIVLSKEDLTDTTKLIGQDTYSKKLQGFFACLKVVV